MPAHLAGTAIAIIEDNPAIRNLYWRAGALCCGIITFGNKRNLLSMHRNGTKNSKSLRLYGQESYDNSEHLELGEGVIMVFIGIISLAIAVGCFFAARSQVGRIGAMNAADTFTAQMLQDLYNQVVPALGGEALAQICEVAGTIEADAALSAPLSGTACVAYTHTVTREYEEDVTNTDEHGKITTSVVRHTETVESNTQHIRFFVRDATGRVLVDSEQATLDLAETGSRYDPAPPTRNARTRTLGYRHEEQALPLGAQVYILGCAVDGGGQPMIARNPRGKQAFFVSRRSERELTSAASSTARWLYYAAGGSCALGMLLLVIGMVA